MTGAFGAMGWCGSGYECPTQTYVLLSFSAYGWAVYPRIVQEDGVP